MTLAKLLKIPETLVLFTYNEDSRKLIDISVWGLNIFDTNKVLRAYLMDSKKRFLHFLGEHRLEKTDKDRLTGKAVYTTS